MRLLACFLALAWLAPTVAWAQVDLVDPDAKKTNKKPPPASLDDEPVGSDEVVDEPEEEPEVVKKDAKDTKDAGVALKEPPKKDAPPPKKEAPPVIVRTITDADLDAAWNKWSQANQSKNQNAELAARKELVALRDTMGSTDAELWALGLLRAAQAWEAKGDSGAAVEIAVTAADLAPHLPATWFLLTRLYFASDPGGVGRYFESLQKGLVAMVSDERYVRPVIADAASVLIVALVATAVVVVLVLLLRRGRLYFHDFHFLFPRAAARWQTAALGALVLLLPVVFRLGVVPTLLLWFAALTLYLTVRERVVVVVLIAMLSLLPSFGQWVVAHTAFAETTAEDLYRLERGGPGTERLIQKYEQLASEDKVGFPERFVLGHAHLNRGHLAQSINHLKAALALRPEDAPSRIALAKALFLQGDLENSRSILEQVRKTSPSAVALVDLAHVYQRRVQVYGDSNVGELGRASAALSEARQLDLSLPALSADEAEPKEIIGNTFLRTLPLPQAELLALAKGDDAAERVRGQIAQILVGDVSSTLGLVYPTFLALLLLGFGFLAKSLDAARNCTRCGRPVSKRGDPEVSLGSNMCAQCVNVFARKNAVAPSVKVRKQLEIARYESQRDRVSTVLGVLWSGMGHVFAGEPVRGAVYGFCFVLAVSGVIFRAGVLRPPFEGVPLFLRVLPLVLLFGIIYPWSLVRLRRRQS